MSALRRVKLTFARHCFVAWILPNVTCGSQDSDSDKTSESDSVSHTSPPPLLQAFLVGMSTAPPTCMPPRAQISWVAKNSRRTHSSSALFWNASFATTRFCLPGGNSSKVCTLIGRPSAATRFSLAARQSVACTSSNTAGHAVPLFPRAASPKKTNVRCGSSWPLKPMTSCSSPAARWWPRSQPPGSAAIRAESSERRCRDSRSGCKRR